MDKLYPLLDDLDQKHAAPPTQVEGWRIAKIAGGANNLLYRVTGEAGDFAVKFTLKDARRRAEREYRALRILQHCGLTLAAQPILLEQERYSHPVVVQSWLEGEVNAEPPQTDAEWHNLIEYLAAVHRVTADQIAAMQPELGFTLHKPVLYAESPENCRDVIRTQLQRIPDEAQSPDLRALAAHYEALPMPAWTPPRLTLIRADPNPRNFIRRAGGWASVDWEYSGISDPAFDIADMCSHAAYISVPPERWQWVIEAYCQRCDDTATAARIRVYRQMMVMWWLVRFAQYLYEIPRGLDPRLVERAPDWQADTERKAAHYMAQAERLFSE